MMGVHTASPQTTGAFANRVETGNDISLGRDNSGDLVGMQAATRAEQRRALVDSVERRRIERIEELLLEQRVDAARCIARGALERFLQSRSVDAHLLRELLHRVGLDQSALLDHLPDHRHRPIGDSWIVGQIGRFELCGRLGIIGIENRPATSVGLVDNGAAEHADGHLLVHETATLFVHANPGNEEGRDAHHMRIDYTVAVE